MKTSSIVFIAIYCAAALLNLVAFLLDGFDLDKLIITVLFVALAFNQATLDQARR